MSIVPTLLAALICTSVGCAMRSVSVEVGATHLVSVAYANYERVDGERIERLLDLLSSEQELPAKETASAGAADSSASGPGGADAALVVSAEVDDKALEEQLLPAGLSLDLALMTESEGGDGRRVLCAVEDGDSLFDGFERPGAGDGLKLRVQADATCTVYVILLDAAARPHALFPNTQWSTVGNPIQASRPYRLPEGNVLFELGPTRGVETLYVVASPEPWLELEELLAEFESASWHRLAVPALVERAARIRRGVAAVHASTAHAVGGPAGTLTDVPSTLFVGKPGARLVVTRWFRHH